MLAGPISKTGSGFCQTGVKGLKGASQEPKKIRFDSAAQLPSHPKWTPKLDLYHKQTQLKKVGGIARMTRLRTLGRCSQIPTPKKKEILAPREDPHQAVFKGVVASFSSASLPSKPRCTIVQIAGQTTLQAFQTGRKAACTIVDSRDACRIQLESVAFYSYVSIISFHHWLNRRSCSVPAWCFENTQ